MHLVREAEAICEHGLDGSQVIDIDLKPRRVTFNEDLNSVVPVIAPKVPRRR